MFFADRADGGRQLAAALGKYQGNKQAIVLGLVRGGVATAYAIAESLHLPLGVMSVKKIGAPNQPELALGAVCADGSTYFNPRVMQAFDISEEDVAQIVAQKQKEAEEKLKRFLIPGHTQVLKNKIAILVDDGLATGATMMASIASARAQGAAKVIVAVPVAALDSLAKAEESADEVYCLYAPEDFMAVGEFYRDFSQVEDQEVLDILTSYQ
jgi:putative phosphoribosyl transferase